MAHHPLADHLTGTVLLPGDPDWDVARRYHWGAGEPALVVRPADVDDVRTAVRHAVAADEPVIPRGGGHSGWTGVPGGVLLDLGALDEVAVDGTRVSVGGGATWGAVSAALAEHRLVISAGDTASVGVGGLTLGGGIGWMVRAWGLAADQLVGAQLVTAAGEVVETSTTQHPDLFWALRGGGGGLGVVTRFDFEAHHVPAIVFATLVVTGDRAAAIRALRDTMRDAPRWLTATYVEAPPPDPTAPQAGVVWALALGDDVEAVRALLAPVLAVPGVVEAEIAARPYADILLEPPHWHPDAPTPGFVAANALVVDLDDGAVDDVVAFGAAHAPAMTLLRSLGGALADAPDSPFPTRDATWFVLTGAFVPPGTDPTADPALVAAVNHVETLGDGVYGNFSLRVDEDYVEELYAPAVRERLADVKRRWDPANTFRRAHTVAPT